MMLFDFKGITKLHLQELIDNKIFENKELEYKDYSFIDGKMTDKHKDKFMKEIAAFANTNGGTIIIGMQEDENRLPTKLSGAGFSLKEFDNWLSSFRQLVLSRIRPHLHGVECIPVELDGDDIAIVISVPKSYARPHSFWDGNKDEFFMRYANGITYMDIDDLRKEFLYTNSVQDKMRQFRRDRISMILANECVGNLGNSAKIVFHIIPEWSFELGNLVNIEKVDRNSNFRPFSGSSWNFRYNADGYCIFSKNKNDELIKTYTQLFHNGIIEVVEIRLISQYHEKQIYDWAQIEEAIIEATENYGDILKLLDVPKPWHIFATLLNAKGYTTCYGGWNDSEVVDRNIVNSLDGIWTDDNNFKLALSPVLNSLSHAFGFSGTSKLNN
ncbi:RNA-binding domain-containing protein [Lacrimispora sp.]|uniref:RNA-binding domain-containing protein n=1 Tax=Lacrimispora sp. TaxID=2719234 RepID=UPI0028ACCFD5|nr:RNA-binding domain-containing protein [Lacrimispora sp.]